MFDTMRAGVSDLNLDCARLLSKGWQRVTYGKMDGEGIVDENTRFVLMRKDQSPHYFAYSPVSGDLRFESSLPKVLHSQNVSMLSDGDLPVLWDELSNEVSEVVGGWVPPVSEWDVRGRLDAVFSWRAVWAAENHVNEYLHAFKSLSLPRHYSESIDRDATVYWRNKARVIRLYDKFRETGLDGAKGLLRFEVQMNHAKAEIGEKGPAPLLVGDVVNWRTARGVLGKYLGGLRADLVVSDDELLFKHLVEYYGTAKARRLFGSVVASRIFSDQELRSMGADRTMIWRDRSAVAKSGASGTLCESGILPALQLPVDFDGEPGELSA